MNRTDLIELIKRKRSFLCVGLDSDPAKFPDHLAKDAQGVVAFNKAIIASTIPYAAAYKLNIAFYEALGEAGWRALAETIKLIPKGEALIIADAKRGDIGNTAAQYAKAFFDQFNCDAITISPYMGADSVLPFLDYADKWSIVLGLTSNKGAEDVELLDLANGRKVFQETMTRIAKLGDPSNLMFVIGATKSNYFESIRSEFPDHFFLVPGVGAQGGTLESLKPLMSPEVGLLVNSSRKIIFASNGNNYAQAAAAEAARLQEEMSKMIG